ncbi:MAG: hypothetical protein U0176_04485 [Bacteroidia bacterium]
MRSASGGRFCDRCSKVVRDFAGVPDAEVQQAILTGKGEVCGRIERDRVTKLPFVTAVLARFPESRLRFFLLAFVMAFGWEVWGLSTLQAQRLEESREELRKPETMRQALVDTGEVVITGLVEDVYTREAVPFARVSAYQNGELLEGAMTDAEGRFRIVVERERFKGATYDLQLYHEGRIRWDSKIALDIREFKYLIDASIMLEGVPITANLSWDSFRDVVGILTYWRSNCKWGDLNPSGAELYRPLDEWLMMHSSEIHHSGRW